MLQFHNLRDKLLQLKLKDLQNKEMFHFVENSYYFYKIIYIFINFIVIFYEFRISDSW